MVCAQVGGERAELLPMKRGDIIVYSEKVGVSLNMWACMVEERRWRYFAFCMPWRVTLEEEAPDKASLGGWAAGGLSLLPHS